MIFLCQIGGLRARAHSITFPYDLLQQKMKRLIEFKNKRKQLVSQPLSCPGQVIAPYMCYFACVY